MFFYFYIYILKNISIKMNNLKNYDEYLNEGKFKNLALAAGLATTMGLASCCGGGDHLAYDVTKNQPIEMSDRENTTIYGKILSIRDEHISKYTHYAVVLIKGKDGITYKVVLDDARKFWGWNEWPLKKGDAVAIVVLNGAGYIKFSDKKGKEGEYFPLLTDVWGCVENDAEKQYQELPKETKTKDQW
jgi:hypothetical protein